MYKNTEMWKRAKNSEVKTQQVLWSIFLLLPSPQACRGRIWQSLVWISPWWGANICTGVSCPVDKKLMYSVDVVATLHPTRMLQSLVAHASGVCVCGGLECVLQ
jgi:hypothetical protein